MVVLGVVGDEAEVGGLSLDLGDEGGEDGLSGLRTHAMIKTLLLGGGAPAGLNAHTIIAHLPARQV